MIRGALAGADEYHEFVSSTDGGMVVAEVSNHVADIIIKTGYAE